MPELRELVRQFNQVGQIQAIVLRPRRGVPAISVDFAEAIAGLGLVGDRSASREYPAASVSNRQVTLLQAEHLPLIASWCLRETVEPTLLRRNLVISGVNLLAARSPFADQAFRLLIGTSVELMVTGGCSPCSKMEVALGKGGYNALRGHGGVIDLAPGIRTP